METILKALAGANQPMLAVAVLNAAFAGYIVKLVWRQQ